MNHFYDIGYSDRKGFFVTLQSQLAPVNGIYYEHLVQAEEARKNLEEEEK